ncbi:MAG: glycoside hydrolase family 3 C-terminal domain-containing protein [Oscillospiraceae bacterium]|nr:glycoside hydrolase family 3 C-terminal domain-containing protein [Oscillospiraceae bacterium]
MREYMNKNLPVEERVESLLSLMTAEEKIAQMTQISYNAVSGEEYERFLNLGIGSFLHVLGEDTQKIREAAQKTRLKIPPIFGIDAIHGHCLLNGATIFPSQLAVSCSFNTELIREMGRVTAREVATDGLDWTFSPVLCIARDLRWGRVDETFGEDSYLIGELGAAIIDGYQCDNLIVACAKHYLGYGEATGGRDAYDTEVTERKIRELFLPPFKRACDAGCGTVMTAYGSIDSVPLTANADILRGLLKEECGFGGFVVTDWENVRALMTNQMVVSSIKDAAKTAGEAGNDMSMHPPKVYACMVELANEGKIDMKYIDDAVRRILRVKFKLGLFDGKAEIPRSVIACEEHRRVNMEITRESLVLLENKNNILPLKNFGDSKTIAVIGPNADDIRAQYGDWTYFSHPEPKENVIPENDYYTVLRGIKTVFKDSNILYNEGCDIMDSSRESIAEAVEAAEKSDVIIAVVGDCLKQYGEFRDRADLELSGAQFDLLKALKATGKPFIGVLINGKPLCIEWLKSNCDALIEAFNGGDLGGLAVAELIAGRFNPSGKLTLSFPCCSSQMPCYYNLYEGWHGGRYMDVEPGNVYDFGYGLSYSSFEYDNLRLSKNVVSRDEEITVSVDITNNSGIDGKEIVELYINDVVSSIMTPVKQLRGFEKVMIKAGDTKTVTMKIKPEDLSFINKNCERTIESCEFEIKVGTSSKEYLTAKLTVE